MEKLKRSESLGNVSKPSLPRCESQLSNITFFERNKQSLIESRSFRVSSPYLRPSKPTPPKEMNF
jgi:hypothetical protein